jgi:hypothetical protein
MMKRAQFASASGIRPESTRMKKAAPAVLCGETGAANPRARKRGNFGICPAEDDARPSSIRVISSRRVPLRVICFCDGAGLGLGLDVVRNGDRHHRKAESIEAAEPDSPKHSHSASAKASADVHAPTVRFVAMKR